MISLHHGSMLDVLKTLEENSVDSCVTDPPYHLTSVVKRFGGTNAAPAQFGTDGAFARASTGFMGRVWDGGDIAFRPETWTEVYRVLKPGAFVAAFGASRGYHRMACAIEDAGFEIRDSLMYIYGTGFPKSHNLDNKRGDLICGCETESPSEHTAQERGQILQPRVSQSSAPNKMDTGAPCETGGKVDGSAQPFMEGRRLLSGAEGQLRVDEVRSLSGGLDRDGAQRRLRDGAPSDNGAAVSLPPNANGMRASLGPRSEKQFACEPGTVAGQSLAQDGGAWPRCGRCGKPMVTRGLGSALKPAFEPIVLARKPLSESTVAANVLKWRTGAINVDACRIHTEGSEAKAYTVKRLKPGATLAAEGGTWKQQGDDAETYEGETKAGRWPANVVHSGEPEVIAAFPISKGQNGSVSGGEPSSLIKNTYGARNRVAFGNRDEAPSSAARFFKSCPPDEPALRFHYSAKASKADRAGSKHPTVKPVSLKEWLCTLITPPGGTVLDPFAGSGTTGAAARNKGFNCILVEREDEYVADIRARLGLPEGADPLSQAIARYRAQRAALAGLAA